MLFTNNTLDALAFAHERGRDLRTEAAAIRLRRGPCICHVAALCLRRAADRPDAPTLSPQPARQ